MSEEGFPIGQGVITSAQADPELFEWLMTVTFGDPKRGIAPAGSFLKSLAEAGLHADWTNYPILRPTLLTFRDKYPRYKPEN